MSSYGLSRPSGTYYSTPGRSYGASPYGASYGSYSKPSYTPPSTSMYGSSYISPSREKSVDRTGYTSDYGKSGYTSDYGKSGYASDRNRMGYTSDYNKPNTNYSSYSKPASYSYGRSVSRQNSITGSDRLSRQNSITGSDRLSRQNSIGGSEMNLSTLKGNESLSRQNSITGSDRLSRQNSLSRPDNLYRRDSYGGYNSKYGGYSRSQSREDAEPKLNGLSKSDSKSRANCKTPADFTSEESESEEETESEDSEIEEGTKLVVTRGTSPEKDTTQNGSSATLAVTRKEKRRINPNVIMTENSCQVVPEDIPTRRQRFISSRPTSLFVNKYYPSPSRFSSTTPSTRVTPTTTPTSPRVTPTTTPTSPRSYGLDNNNNADSSLKSPDNVPSSPTSPKVQLTVDEPASHGGFSRDASPNARMSDEPNKDFRKSVLNMNVDEKLRDVYGRRQEERRHHRRRKNKDSLGVNQESSSSATPSSSSDDETQPLDQEQETKKKKILKKSPSRSGILSKCNSRSKMEALKKSPSHARVQRRAREDGVEETGLEKGAETSSSSASTSSSSEDENNRSRARQRRRVGGRSSQDTEETQQDSKEEAPTVVVHPPETRKSSDDDESERTLQRIMKVPSGESSDLTSPGEVVHLSFPPPRSPVPLERVDSGRNVAVSLNVADFIKPRPQKRSSSSEESSSGSSQEEDERDLATPVVPVTEPSDNIQPTGEAAVEKSPPALRQASSSSEEEEEEEEEDEEEEDEENGAKEGKLLSVQKSATVIQFKEPKKEVEESSSEEESSEEESSEEESEDENEKLKRCPTQVIKPVQQVTEKKKTSSEEESSEEEESSKDDKKNEPERKLSSEKTQLQEDIPQVNGESYWPKLEKKDSLQPPDNLNLFIGKCQDIDEMLGAPSSPMSPGSANNSSTPTKQQPFQFQPQEPKPTKEESSSSSSSSEEESSSSDLEEVEASAVKVHETIPQKPKLGAYTEEIDSSAVRIRESKPLSSEFAAEEIDSSSVKIRQANIMHGHISKAPTKRAAECDIVKKTMSNGTLVDPGRRRSSTTSAFVAKAKALIEKMSTTPSRDLRRTLFSLKQVFQDEKDLTGPFLEAGGLSCLVKVGTDADQNYQNYILRALGQMMLYVDGMSGIAQHMETVKWLYTLSASKYRIVSKMAVKLMLMLVEYAPSNALLLKDAVSQVDRMTGSPLWSNIMHLLNEKENLDMELLVYCMTLVNKVADGFTDQDSYFDFVDALEEQGMEKVSQFHMCRAGTDKELLKQLQIYEAVLKHEDGEDDGKPFPGKFIERSRNMADRGFNRERRKSRRHSTPILPTPPTFMAAKSPPPPSPTIKKPSLPWVRRDSRESEKPFEISPPSTTDPGIDIDDDTGITPALRRRRDARNRTLTGRDDANYPAPQQALPSPEVKEKPTFHSDRATKPCVVSHQRSLFENKKEEPPKEPLVRRSSREGTSLVKQQIQAAEVKPVPPPSPTKPTFGRQNSQTGSIPTTPPTTAPKKFYGQSNRRPAPYTPPVEQPKTNNASSNNAFWGKNQKSTPEPAPEPPKFQLKRDNSTHKDFQNKFRAPEPAPVIPEPPKNRYGGSPGLVSRAKEGLAGSNSSRPEQKSPMVQELRKSASGVKELHWDQLMQTMRRPLRINDLDFTDLGDEDDVSLLVRPTNSDVYPGAPPPPPPPGFGGPPPPPPPPGMGGPPPPPPPGSGVNRGGAPAPPPWIRRNAPATQQQNEPKLNKKVKTVKLFWKEVKEEPSLLERCSKKRTIWDELKIVSLDTQRIENLFESKAKDIMSKKVSEGGKKSELIVLDTKRSNAINIGMTKLPPKGAIKAAILKMDSTIMNREGIEKILTTMLPTEEEKNKIIQAQLDNPDIPLGSAEQFLLTLASISELEARLKLWAFRLDYETMEKEVAEPLMDLKQAIFETETSQTFRAILSTLLTVGNFLNNTNAKGFSLEYLSKVPEVKDTVHKHSLLHHTCTIVMEKFPESTNLYSEFGAVTRASKVDFDEVAKNLIKMETECKASWEYLKAVTKHDGIPINKSRLSDFLDDCAQRIIVLGIIHRRVTNRFLKLLVYLGFPSHQIREAKVHAVCKVISEFALEYRTCRERVQQQIEKAAALKAKTKAKANMVAEAERLRQPTKEQRQDQQLRQILGESDAEESKMTKWGSMVNLRGRPKNAPVPGNLSRPNSVMMLERCGGGYSTPYESTTDIDEEILDSLVKTVTGQPNRMEPRNRKKARYADRKSLRRTLKGGLDIGDAIGT